MKVKVLAFSALSSIAALLVGGALMKGTLAADSQAAPAWAVSGLWSEACPCNPPCPCWNGRIPTFGHCENIQTFQITKGQYGDVRLDGVIVVVAWVTPEGELMGESIGRSRLFAIYVDASTTEAQRDAVNRLWRSAYFSGVKAARGELKVVAMKADIRPNYVQISIPGVLAYEVKESNGKAVDLKRTTRADFRQGVSVRFRYSDFGVKWDYPGKHAMFGTFQAQSQQTASASRPGR